MKNESFDNHEMKEQEPLKTNWVVVFGPPSSGKTTTFEDLAPQLKAHDFTPIPEVEREIIEKDQEKGIMRENTPEYAMMLEHRFLDARDKMERSLDPGSRIIMDRGIPEIIAYARYYKADETFAMPPAKRVKYKQVFYLEPLVSYEQDITRVENPEFAKWMHENLPRVYEELGYDIIRVPIFPYGEEEYESEDEKKKDSLAQRSRFIMEKMKEEFSGEGGEKSD